MYANSRNNFLSNQIFAGSKRKCNKVQVQPNMQIVLSPNPFKVSRHETVKEDVKKKKEEKKKDELSRF